MELADAESIIITMNALKVNHLLQVFEVSATQGAGMDAWRDWLVSECTKCK